MTSMSETLCTKPAVSEDLPWMAEETIEFSYSPTKVMIGFLSVGGVLSSVKSLIPVGLISSVRGIGVAVRVRTSTLLLNDLIFSCV